VGKISEDPTFKTQNYTTFKVVVCIATTEI